MNFESDFFWILIQSFITIIQIFEHELFDLENLISLNDNTSELFFDFK